VRSHRFLLAQHAALQEAIALEPGEVDLTTLPVFVLANLASGVTSVLPAVSLRRPGAVKVAPLAAQMTRTRPTRTGGSPAFYLRLAEQPETLAGLQKIYTGGAPVFPSTLQTLRRAAPSARVVAVYGSTEAEPIAHVAAEEIAEADWSAMAAGRGLLAGRPVPQIRLRIIADQWGGPVRAAAPLPSGAVGEIVVTGAHVLRGYLHGQGDDETKFHEDGAIWHRTGDAGWLDDAGRLWLLGRCAARIEDEHGTIYPFAVECVAMTLPGVRRAAFVLHRDRRVLVLETAGPPPDGESLPVRLAWARVGEVRILDALPVDRRHNAKIDYPALARALDRTDGRA
jgi:acyl-CoA synthetase (AMP-forming)/AMP-acid ligase II